MDAASRRAGRKLLAKMLEEDPQHPLYKALIDPNTGRLWSAKGEPADLFERVGSIDMGHKHFGKGDQAQFAVESSHGNRFQGLEMGENQTNFQPRVFVEVTGPGGKSIPIEEDTLRTLEFYGKVPPGTLAAAKPSEGWRPDFLLGDRYAGWQAQLPGTEAERRAEAQFFAHDPHAGSRQAPSDHNLPAERGADPHLGSAETSGSGDGRLGGARDVAGGERGVRGGVVEGTVENELGGSARASRAGERGFASVGGMVFALAVVGTAVYVYRESDGNLEKMKDLSADLVADALEAEAVEQLGKRALTLGTGVGAEAAGGLPLLVVTVAGMATDSPMPEEEQRNAMAARFLHEHGLDDVHGIEYEQRLDEAYVLLFLTEPAAIYTGDGYHTAVDEAHSVYVDPRGESHPANVMTASGPAYVDPQGHAHAATLSADILGAIHAQLGGQPQTDTPPPDHGKGSDANAPVDHPSQPPTQPTDVPAKPTDVDRSIASDKPHTPVEHPAQPHDGAPHTSAPPHAGDLPVSQPAPHASPSDHAQPAHPHQPHHQPHKAAPHPHHSTGGGGTGGGTPPIDTSPAGYTVVPHLGAGGRPEPGEWEVKHNGTTIAYVSNETVKPAVGVETKDGHLIVDVTVTTGGVHGIAVGYDMHAIRSEPDETDTKPLTQQASDRPPDGPNGTQPASTQFSYDSQHRPDDKTGTAVTGVETTGLAQVGGAVNDSGATPQATTPAGNVPLDSSTPPHPDQSGTQAASLPLESDKTPQHHDVTGATVHHEGGTAPHVDNAAANVPLDSSTPHPETTAANVPLDSSTHPQSDHGAAAVATHPNTDGSQNQPPAHPQDANTLPQAAAHPPDNATPAHPDGSEAAALHLAD